MIPKGLKVGDTFVDGNETFRVVKVIGEMYSSVVVGEAPPPQLDEVKEDFDSLPYAELKKICAERGLSAKGSKQELIARLEG